MTRETYKSVFGQRIRLSFTGRHLLQSLRDAIQDALARGDYNANNQELSRARARIAEYMSKLEEKNLIPQEEEESSLRHARTEDLVAELTRRCTKF